MNRLFRGERSVSPETWVERHVDSALGHRDNERSVIVEWMDEVRRKGRDLVPSTATPVIEQELQLGDARALHLVPQILKDFKPRVITVQILGLDEAHETFSSASALVGYERYLRHLKTLDELIGSLWRSVQSDPYLRETTALVIRPDCGRDREVNPLGQLDHTAGDDHAHTVWTMALGPDFPRGRTVTRRVDRKDLAPSLTYLMTGQRAEFSTGQIRWDMFTHG